MSKYCDVCKKTVCKYSGHIKTKRHLRNLQGLEVGGVTFAEEEDELEEEENELVDIADVETENITFETTEDFLSEMNNINYKKPAEMEEIDVKPPPPKREEIPPYILNIMNKKRVAKKPTIKEDDDVSVLSEPELFSNKPTEILGKDRRELLNKIRQYKHLFAAELKKFRIKKKPTIEELRAYLEEIDVIINTNSVDGFINESILQSLKIVEGVSAMTKNYNITGLSDLLRNNPQFQHLTKQLYLKYGNFTNVPPENQLVFIVLTSAWVCRNKNAQRAKLDAFLDNPTSS